MHTFIKKKQVNKQTDNVNKQIAAASTTTTTASTTRKLTQSHFAPIRVKPFARKKTKFQLSQKATTRIVHILSLA